MVQDPNIAGEGDDSSRGGIEVGSARFTLVVRSADGKEREYELARAKTIIGRMSRCDLMVALPVVADRHCEVVLDEEGLVVTDLDTEHGTMINGQRVKTARLRDGDVLGVGPMRFFVRDRHHGRDEIDDTFRAAVEDAGNVDGEESNEPDIVTMPPRKKTIEA